jgi:hypothetical protein
MGGILCYSHKQLDFEQGPYGIKTVSTRFYTYRSGSTRIVHVHVTCTVNLGDSGGYGTARKKFWSWSKFLCVSNRVEISFKSIFDPSRPVYKTLSHPIAWRTMQYTTKINAVLHCGSMRLELGQYGYQYGIEIRVKNLNMTKTFFSAVSYSRNTWGIDAGFDAGLYGWNRVDTVLLPYGPGSKSGCVWLNFRNSDLIVNCLTRFSPCGPASNSWFTHTEPCQPAAANIKEKLVKLDQAFVDTFRTAATPTDPYTPFSYSGNQPLNPYTKSVFSRFYPDRRQITIYSWTISAYFHLHQIWFVTRLCVTVA